MPTVSSVLTELVAEAAERAGHGGVLDEVEPARPASDPRFGDYQSNHAFRLGRALRTNPRAVAEAVRAALAEHPAVASVEVAGPGFLNFRLDDGWLGARLGEMVRDPHLFVEQSGAGRTVVIDYSSPNVAKRMHVGHMRSTIIGNTLDRLHRATGWRVIADNHVGDWGTQYGKLIVAWRRWVDREAFEADPLGELERLYVRFGREAEADPALLDEARAETAKLQAGDPDNRALWERFRAVSLAEFEAVYERLHVRFDEVLGESAYHDELAGTVQALLDAGVAEESEGAVVVKFPADEVEGRRFKGLADTVLVIRKKDGAFLYGTTDLATLEYRRRRWAPDAVVYVTDMRQQLHFKQVFAAWRRWSRSRGLDPDRPALVHTWFGMLVLPEGAMSSRKGNVVRLVDLLDEAVRRARVVVDDKSPDLPEAERARIAEAVGVGAVRYADLSQNPQSNVTFDWDRMLALDGNTAPYLLYTHARCRSLLARAAGEGARPGEAVRIGESLERELVLRLLRFPEAVDLALAHGRPNLLCDQLYETANVFNRFYYEVPVLRGGDDATVASRLALVEAAATVMRRGLELLGIEVLDRM